jgi:hypothetical protein
MFIDSNQRRDWSKLQQARDLVDQEPQCYNFPDAFFPEKGASGQVLELRWAKETCAACPLKIMCGEYGIRWEKHGVWGGLSSKQRVKIRQQRKLPEPIEDAA